MDNNNDAHSERSSLYESCRGNCVNVIIWNVYSCIVNVYFSDDNKKVTT